MATNFPKKRAASCFQIIVSSVPNLSRSFQTAVTREVLTAPRDSIIRNRSPVSRVNLLLPIVSNKG